VFFHYPRRLEAELFHFHARRSRIQARRSSPILSLKKPRDFLRRHGRFEEVDVVVADIVQEEQLFRKEPRVERLAELPFRQGYDLLEGGGALRNGEVEVDVVPIRS